VRAATFAAERHRHQRRKDEEASPYINHPLSLAAILVLEGDVQDAEVIAAALLHDTVEDTFTTLDELEAQFGPRVARTVSEVTDDKSLPKEQRKLLQVEHTASISDSAKLVKIADKICNARDILDHPPASWGAERKVEYLLWARDVLRGVRGVNARLDAAFDEILRRGSDELRFQL
jgi:guanosine-3',5'-bis(diphosphate) 3'-pyrophosphohydrolase